VTCPDPELDDGAVDVLSPFELCEPELPDELEPLVRDDVLED